MHPNLRRGILDRLPSEVRNEVLDEWKREADEKHLHNTGWDRMSDDQRAIQIMTLGRRQRAMRLANLSPEEKSACFSFLSAVDCVQCIQELSLDEAALALHALPPDMKAEILSSLEHVFILFLVT